MDWIKSHPVMTGGIVIGVVVLTVLLSGGDSETVAGAPTSEVGAGTALQQLQAQLQDRSASRTTALEMQAGENETRRYLADLATSLAFADINSRTSLSTLEINKTAEVNTHLAELQADTEQYRLETDYMSDKLMSDYMTAGLHSQEAITKAVIAGQVQIAQINKPKRGLFSMIFG